MIEATGVGGPAKRFYFNPAGVIALVSRGHSGTVIVLKAGGSFHARESIETIYLRMTEAWREQFGLVSIGETCWKAVARWEYLQSILLEDDCYACLLMDGAREAVRMDVGLPEIDEIVDGVEAQAWLDRQGAERK